MKQLTGKEKDLIRRYLVWCYKTTKEALDKVDRYFTQLQADDFVLRRMKKTKEYQSSSSTATAYKDLVDQFQRYREKKEADVLKKKFKDGRRGAFDPGYQYLHNRLGAVEEAICHFLGAKELKAIGRLYEQEMTRRILEAREH